MITIKEYTTKAPLQMIGEFSGICWGANIEDRQKNIKRAWDCIESGHGRTEEFTDVYVVIDGYSAACLRELYTHIGGSPTRLQASTRYIDYAKGFDPGNETKFMERMRVRTPTNMNIPAMVKTLQGCDLADVPMLILTIDPCISCTER